MTRHQELLDDEIGQPPPTRIDVSAVMARQRRWVRLQRAGWVASGMAATAALVVGAAAVPHLAAGAGSVGVIGAGRTTTQSTPTSTTRPPSPARQQEAARLSAELQKQLKALLPTATFLPLAEPPDGSGTSLPTSVPLVFSDAGKYFYTSALVKTSAGIGAIRIQTGNLDNKVERGPSVCDDPAPGDVKITECKVMPGPNGSAIFIITDTIGKNFQRHFVEITRADGNSVSFEVMNGASEPVATSSRPPLTSRQTQTVAEDPVLAAMAS